MTELNNSDGGMGIDPAVCQCRMCIGIFNARCMFKASLMLMEVRGRGHITVPDPEESRGLTLLEFEGEL